MSDKATDERVMITKRRARKLVCFAHVPSTGYHPEGVGGFAYKEPCISFDVGDHRVTMTWKTWEKLQEAINNV